MTTTKFVLVLSFLKPISIVMCRNVDRRHLPDFYIIDPTEEESTARPRQRDIPNTEVDPGNRELLQHGPWVT